MTLLIPAYEPDGKLLQLIRDLQLACSLPILIVDDGSGPRFEFILRAAEMQGCTVLRHPVNQGKGAALKTGFRHLLQRGEPDGVVCADCDGQHAVPDILRVAALTAVRKDTAILGARQFTGLVPFKSRFGNRVTRTVFRWSAGYRLEDTQTGLRGYPAAMLSWLCEIKGSRFEYELSLLLALKPAGWRIREIPIRTIYDEPNHSTHFRPFLDSIKVYLPFVKFSAASLAAGLLDFLLLMLLSHLTGNLLLSVVVSRIVSATFNYGCNLWLVFRQGAHGASRSAPRYLALALLVLALNYLLLLVFTSAALPLAIAKLITEGLLFMFSYEMQKHVVFRKPNPA